MRFALNSLLLARRRQRQARRVEEQLPEMLLSLTGALRAGLSLHQALIEAAGDTPPPLGPALRRCADGVALGISWTEALDALRLECPGEGTTLLVWALSVHLRSGGDLPALAERLHELLVERRRLHGRLLASTAQMRMSAGVVLLVPLFLAASLSQLAPGYLDPLLHTRAGWALLFWAGSMTLIGLALIRRLSSFRW